MTVPPSHDPEHAPLDDAHGDLADRLAEDGINAQHDPEDDQAPVHRAAQAFRDLLHDHDASFTSLTNGDDSNEAPPTLPEDYEFIEEIGRGGMGVVYKARQKSLARIVAIKVLHPAMRLFSDSIRRFQREARLLARLRHPNIVSVYEVGEIDGHVYFTMEWVDGEPLSHYLTGMPLQTANAVHLVNQVASAIAYVHEHGLVHRDLKPANILVDDQDVAYVTDFGLAMELNADSTLTLTGQVIGTPAYMSPEQARGNTDAVSESSDVYALGVMLYECLSGKRPFEERSPAEQVYAVIHQDPPPLRNSVRNVPRDLETIAQKAMHKRPDKRYLNAEAMRDDLERFEAGRPIRGRPPSGWERAKGAVRRHNLALSAITGLVLLASLISILALRPHTRDQIKRAQQMEFAQQWIEFGREQEDLAQHEHAARAYAQALSIRKTNDTGNNALFYRYVDAALASAKSAIIAGKGATCDATLKALSNRASAHFGDRDWPGQHRLATYLSIRDLQIDPTEARVRRVDLHLRTWLSSRSVWGRYIDRPRVLAEVIDLAIPGILSDIDSKRNFAQRLFECASSQDVPAGINVNDSLFEVPYAVIRHLQTRTQRELRAGLTVLIGMTRAPLKPVSRGTLRLRAFPYVCKHLVTNELIHATLNIVEDSSLDEHTRQVGSLILCELCDLPLNAAIDWMGDRDAPLLFDPVRVASIVAQLMRLPPEEAATLRIDTALEELKAAPSRPPYSDEGTVYTEHTTRQWITAHTGFSFFSESVKTTQLGKTEQFEQWWQANKHHGPTTLLSDALNKSEGWIKRNPRYALGALDKYDETKKRQLHQLFKLVVDPISGTTPLAGIRGDDLKYVAMRWRQILDAGSSSFFQLRPRQLRVGILNRKGITWQANPQFEWHSPIHFGSQLGFNLLRVPSKKGRAFGLATLPGFTNDVPSELLSIAEKISVHLTRTELRGELRVHSSAFGNHFECRNYADFISSPDVHLIPSPMESVPRNGVTLFCVSTDNAVGGSWDITDWKSRLSSDLARLATRAQANLQVDYPSDFLHDYESTISTLVAIASQIPLPQATSSLATIQECLYENQFPKVAFASLFAGDEAILDNQALVRNLTSSDGRDVLKSFYDNRSGGHWARLAIATKKPRIREFAFSQLKRLNELHPAVAGELLEASRAGHIETPSWLQTRLSQGPTQDHSWWSIVKSHRLLSVGVLFLWALALILTLLVLRSRLRKSGGLVPAAWLVALGLLFICLDAVYSEHNLLPKWAGYVFAFVGSFVLGRSNRQSPYVTTAALFAAAFLASILRAFEIGLPVMWFIEYATTVGAIVTIYPLSKRLRTTQIHPTRDGIKTTRLRRFVVGLSIAATFTILVVATIFSHHVRVPWEAYVSLAALLLAVMLIRDQQRSKRSQSSSLPALFVLFYVFPSLTALGILGWSAWNSQPLWTVYLGGFGGLFVPAGASCVAAALIYLVQSARIRKAYLRLQSSLATA